MCCCENVPILSHDYELLKSFAYSEIIEETRVLIHAGYSVIIPKTSDGWCAFLNKETRKCMVYINRPDICRLYGTKILPCIFIRPDGKRRKKSEMKNLEKIKTELNENDKRNAISGDDPIATKIYYAQSHDASNEIIEVELP